MKKKFYTIKIRKGDARYPQLVEYLQARQIDYKYDGGFLDGLVYLEMELTKPQWEELKNTFSLYVYVRHCALKED